MNTFLLICILALLKQPFPILLHVSQHPGFQINYKKKKKTRLTRPRIKGRGIIATEINPNALNAHPTPRDRYIWRAARGSAPPNELRKRVSLAKTPAIGFAQTIQDGLEGEVEAWCKEGSADDGGDPVDAICVYIID